MKEDIFCKVGYGNFLQEEEKKSWTSRILKKIKEHRIIVCILLITVMCIGINFWLIYKFMNILETNALIY